MSLKQEPVSASRVLKLPIDKLLKSAYEAVTDKNIHVLKDIDLLVKRYFCKKIAQFEVEELTRFNKLLVNFLAWFEWGGKPRWKKAVSIINRWETILEISQLIFQTESPQRASMLIKEEYGRMIVKLLYDKESMRPFDIKEALKTISIQKLSVILSKFEKAGIITRIVEGKNVWVSLARLGFKVYKEYIKPYTENITRLINSALKELDKKEFGKAQEKLLTVKEIEPDNPFAVCLLGIIALEKGELSEAGKQFSEAAKLGLDKEKTFLVFYILEQNKKLNFLINGIYKINFQNDRISKEVKPSLYFLGLLYEYLGNESRANECYRMYNM